MLPHTMDEIKQIPYGISDFERLRTENFYYVDKTRFIGMIERAAHYLFLLRPRRQRMAGGPSGGSHPINQAEIYPTPPTARICAVGGVGVFLAVA